MDTTQDLQDLRRPQLARCYNVFTQKWKRKVDGGTESTPGKAKGALKGWNTSCDEEYVSCFGYKPGDKEMIFDEDHNSIYGFWISGNRLMNCGVAVEGIDISSRISQTDI